MERGVPVFLLLYYHPTQLTDPPSLLPMPVRVPPLPPVQADRFVRTGKTLRRQMWWQNCKMKLVMAFAVLLLGVVIFLLVCFSGKNCLKKG